MTSESRLRLRARLRNILCVLCLVVFVLSEAYSAADIALDQFVRRARVRVGAIHS